ncbi:MAG: cupredoxin domain-containing protein [Chloroflexi bacterium]|nr:cupredoxin domain-containing protein [Chloroflexota bacterium]
MNRNKLTIAATTLFLILAAMVVPLPLSAAAPQSRDIAINARTFAFEPSTLQVNHGDEVTLHFESLDASHGLFIDGYDVDIKAEPGKSAHVTFAADRAGKFKFRCSISCGVLHPFMIGEIEVSPDLPLLRAFAATMLAAVGAVLFFWRGE